MTRDRYLVLADATPARIAAIDAAIADRLGLRSRRIGKRGALWTPRGSLPVELDDHGIVIGSLYGSNGVRPGTELPPGMSRRVIATHGDELLRCCWGGYVAIIVDRHGERLSVLRAPMGDLPCYVAETGNGEAVASDVGLLVAAGAAQPAIDWPAVARHLAAPDIRRSETCLAGITELPGGNRLTLDGESAIVEERWSPWSYAGPDQQIESPEEAQQRIRQAIDHAVAELAADQPHVILKLSGGLDSSIVAAALAHAGSSFDCVNLVTDDATGDERLYARLVADAVDRPLIERLRQVDRVELAHSAAARLPRPSARGFAQASDSAVAEIAVAQRASAVFDGGGGDNVFCSQQSVRPVVDCWRDDRGRGAFWSTARSVGALAQVSLWTVLRRTWRSHRRRSEAYPWPVDRRLLTARAIDDAAGATDHPWFYPPHGALPGKAAHVALIAQAQSVAEGFDSESSLPIFSPLLSQPVIEACLRVPSWRWFDGPLNRAAARAAFAGSLPSEVIRRTSKGSPDGFIAELYEANRAAIRTLLLEGELAGHGIIDVAAVCTLLDDPRPVIGHAHLRVLQLVDAEAWARAWSGV